ncbi:MAG: GNAT family N-acetyltransferase [Betaproteobacteria bacterium]
MRRPDPSIRFRAARQDEADALTEIVMSAKASWGYAPDQLEAWRPSLAVTRSQIQRQPVFVAEVARRTVGFYSLRVTADGCELDNCWIVPGQMRRGYGRALLAHAVDSARARGAAAIRIDADPNAEPFYLACGAITVGRLPAPIPGLPSRCRPQMRLPL